MYGNLQHQGEPSVWWQRLQIFKSLRFPLGLCPKPCAAALGNEARAWITQLLLQLVSVAFAEAHSFVSTSETMKNQWFHDALAKGALNASNHVPKFCFWLLPDQMILKRSVVTESRRKSQNWRYSTDATCSPYYLMHKHLKNLADQRKHRKKPRYWNVRNVAAALGDPADLAFAHLSRETRFKHFDDESSFAWLRRDEKSW